MSTTQKTEIKPEFKLRRIFVVQNTSFASRPGVECIGLYNKWEDAFHDALVRSEKNSDFELLPETEEQLRALLPHGGFHFGNVWSFSDKSEATWWDGRHIMRVSEHKIKPELYSIPGFRRIFKFPMHLMSETIIDDETCRVYQVLRETGKKDLIQGGALAMSIVTIAHRIVCTCQAFHDDPNTMCSCIHVVMRNIGFNIPPRFMFGTLSEIELRILFSHADEELPKLLLPSGEFGISDGRPFKNVEEE